MKLIFDHKLGKVENSDLVICNPLAEVEEEYENEAVETGWLALDYPVNNTEVFYQSRSTRIDLDKYKSRFKSHKLHGEDIKMKEVEANEMLQLVGLPQIYREYMKRKGFKADYNPFKHMHTRDSFLIFYIGKLNNIIAFTKLKKYHYQEDTFGRYTQQLGDPNDDNGLWWAGYESVIHCNKEPISQLTLDMEMAWAKEHRAGYYYMGSGYETSSEYKSKWDGFEWWTGTKWSTSKSLYKRLCRSDSRTKTLNDIAKIPSLLPKASNRL
jgi:hypothetical protein